MKLEFFRRQPFLLLGFLWLLLLAGGGGRQEDVLWLVLTLFFFFGWRGVARGEWDEVWSHPLSLLWTGCLSWMGIAQVMGGGNLFAAFPAFAKFAAVLLWGFGLFRCRGEAAWKIFDGIVLAVSGVQVLFRWVTVFRPGFIEQPYLFSPNPQFGAYWMMAGGLLCLSRWWGKPRETVSLGLSSFVRPLSLLWAGGAILFAWTMCHFNSRSGLMGWGAGALWLAGRRFGLRGWLLGVTAGLGAAVALPESFWQTVLKTHDPLAFRRTDLWAAAWGGIVEKPIWGWGAGDFQNLYYRHMVPWMDSAVHWDHGTSFAHNDYLQWGAYWGVPALLVLGLLVGYTVASGWRRRDLGSEASLLGAAVFSLFNFPFFLLSTGWLTAGWVCRLGEQGPPPRRGWAKSLNPDFAIGRGIRRRMSDFFFLKKFVRCPCDGASQKCDRASGNAAEGAARGGAAIDLTFCVEKASTSFVSNAARRVSRLSEGPVLAPIAKSGLKKFWTAVLVLMTVLSGTLFVARVSDRVGWSGAAVFNFAPREGALDEWLSAQHQPTAEPRDFLRLEKKLRALLTFQPDAPHANYTLAHLLAHHRKGSPSPEVMRLYARAVAGRPRDAVWALEYGQFLLAQGEVLAAEEAVRSALKTEPFFVSARVFLSEVLSREGLWRLAEDNLRDLWAFSTPVPQVATSHYRAVILRRDDRDILASLAGLRLIQGDAKGALALLIPQPLSPQYPLHFQPRSRTQELQRLVMTAGAERRLGHRPQARRLLEEALQIAPGDPFILEKLHLLEKP